MSGLVGGVRRVSGTIYLSSILSPQPPQLVTVGASPVTTLVAISLGTAATHRQVSLPVIQGWSCDREPSKGPWLSLFPSLSLSLHLCSDVNCGMLFCNSNGQYQRTANVGVTIVTVRVSGGECE